MRARGPSGELHVHLPTGIKGYIFWEVKGPWGHFIATSGGVEFTAHKDEVIPVTELEAAA